MTGNGFVSRLRGSKAARFAAAAVVILQTLAGGLAGAGVAYAATIATNQVNVASVGFVLSGSYSLVNGIPTGAGQLKNGNVGAYPEGACIPMLFSATNNSASTGDIVLSPVYDYSSTGTAINDLYGISISGKPTAATNLNQFTYSGTPLTNTTYTTASGATVTAVVSGPYSGNSTGTATVSSSDTARHYNMTLQSVAPGDTVYVTFCAKLGLDASQYNGSSLSVRTAQYGQENVPIPVNQLLVLPSITISKTVVGGSAVASDFSFNVSPAINGVSAYSIPTGQTSVTINNVSPDGNYTITENGLAGYVFSSGTGTNCTFSGSTATATVAAAKTPTNATCSFTNSAQPLPQLTVIKHVVNDNGGTKSASDFTMNVTATSPSQSSFAGAESPGTTITLSPGTYSVDEGSHTGYTETKSTGCSGTLDYGQSATCTITNDDIAPTLSLVKQVTNDNGGTAIASQWTLSATPSDNHYSTLSGAGGFSAQTAQAGVSYALSESGGPAGYSPSSWSCSAGTLSGSTLTLALGDAATCTITNDDQPGSLTVIKQVVHGATGDTTAASAFTMNVTGTNVSSGSFPGSSSGTAVTLDAGTYGVTEGSHAGYTVSYSGDCNGTMTVGGSKTCTVTNTAISPTLTINKILDYSYGGTASIGDFIYQITDSSGNTQTVLAGVATTLPIGTYTVSEGTMPFGYQQESIGGDCSGLGVVTLALGDTKTCSITNQDQPATLTVVKTVSNNHGGTLGASSFTMHVEQNGTDSVTPFAGSATGTALTLSAGTYTVSEGDPSNLGYTQTGVVCDGQATATVTLAVGDSKTCTITNEDIAPTVTLTKNVINDNGGTAGPDDFGLTVGGQPVTSGQTVDVTAGTDVALNEAGLSGYQFVSITGDAGCPGVLGGTVNLLPGQNIACTINNNDVAPTLTLVKVVNRNHGGTAGADDFGISIDGSVVTSGAANTELANTPLTINEIGLPGYQFVSLTGTGCPAALGGTITLSPGQNAVCTITNQDTAPGLTVIKQVVHGTTGDTTAASAFTMNVSATNVSDASFPGSSTGTAVTLDAGSYNVTEGDHTGYAVSYSTDCNGTIAVGDSKTCTVTNTAISPTLTINKTFDYHYDGTAGIGDFIYQITDSSGSTSTVLAGVATKLAIGTYTVSEGTMPFGYQQESIGGDCTGAGVVTLALGDTKTCSITNTDQPATLTVVKTVSNLHGGLLGPNAFTLHVQQNGTDVVTPFAGNDAGTALTLSAGTYTVSEDDPTTQGYVQSGVICDGQSTDTVTLTVGQSKTCTITNEDIAPTVTLTKVVNETHGGTATPDDFGLTVGGQPVTSGQAVDVTANTDLALDEAGLYGYQFVSLTGDPGCPTVLGGTVNLLPGQSISCTITNEDLAASITVVKFHDRNADTVQDPGEEVLSGWTINLTGPQGQVVALTPNSLVTDNSGQVTFDNLSAGTYTVSEDQQSGWAQSGIVCNETSGATITVGVGDEVLCTIGNYQPAIHLVKSVSPTSGSAGDTVTYTFTVTNPGDTPLSNVILSDNLLPAGSITGPTGDTNHDNLLDPGETWVYTASYQIPSDQDVVNIATVQGTDTGPGKGNVTDTSQAIVDVGSVLGASTGGGQVLGAATELPPTGADPETALLFAAFASTAAFVASLLRQRRRSQA